MDLFSRRNKFNGSATFAIKLGPKPIVPTVALVCDFDSRPHPTLLFHYELETLFHEFGHCLAGLLSRTQYQHVNGMRAALDFVETPSTLMEFFAWDYRILRLFARHYITGDVLPKELLIEQKKGKQLFSALETQQQVCLALFDQTIHGWNPHQSKTMSTTTVLEQLQNQHTFIPFVPGTHWHSTFGHLVGYGAGAPQSFSFFLTLQGITVICTAEYSVRTFGTLALLRTH